LLVERSLIVSMSVLLKCMGLSKGMRALPLMLWCIAGGVPSLVQPGKMVRISMDI